MTYNVSSGTLNLYTTTTVKAALHRPTRRAVTFLPVSARTNQLGRPISAAPVADCKDDGDASDEWPLIQICGWHHRSV